MNEKAQHMFDATYALLLAQGGPSTNGNYMCMYKGPNGRRCAAGHWITDERYLPSMEGGAIGMVNEHYRLKFDEAELEVLKVLQVAHDAASAMPHKSWPAALGKTMEAAAQELNIKYRVPPLEPYPIAMSWWRWFFVGAGIYAALWLGYLAWPK